MTAVDLLARFLTGYKFTLPFDQVATDSGLTDLERLGIIQHRAAGAAMICDACDLTHPVTVEIDPITDRLGWRCPSAGFVEADAEILRSVRLDVEALVARIWDALQCKRRRQSPLIENVLWSIGYFEFQSNDVNVYLTRLTASAEDLREIAAALQAEAALRSVLVISPDFSGASGLTITGCRIAALRDAVHIDKHGLSCDQSQIAALAGVVLPKRGGRPRHANSEEAMALILSRFRTGACEDGVNAEARAVSEILGIRAPGNSTLKSMISGVRGGQ